MFLSSLASLIEGELAVPGQGVMRRADMAVGVSDYKAERKKLFLCSFPSVGSDEFITYHLMAISVEGHLSWLILKAPKNTVKTHTHRQMMPKMKRQQHRASMLARRLDDTTS